MALRRTLNYWWQQLRCFFGNDSYKRYLHHHAIHHADLPFLDRRTFYLREQERKWNGIRRCC
ncbi:conserved hypothetical protein [Gammaproteobacteria bacterium]